MVRRVSNKKIYEKLEEILKATKNASMINFILSLVFFCFAASIAVLSLFLMTGIANFIWISLGFLIAIGGIAIITIIIGIHQYNLSKKDRE